MAKFQYGKTIADSFRLVFGNLYIFVPVLLITIISMLFLPFYFKLLTPTGSFDFQFIASNLSYALFIAACAGELI